ncbi:MAG: extensin family protein [Pseudomonadota bacterium]
MTRAMALVCCLVWANFALAAPQQSERPPLRPEAKVSLSPPGSLETAAPSNGVRRSPQSGAALRTSLRPELRTRRIERAARAWARERRREEREEARLLQRGAVCGDIEIQGTRVAAFKGRVVGCGIAEPVRVKSVSGVTLSQASLMDCPTAKALKTWVETTVKPTLSPMGGGLTSLQVAAHYVCKTRNSRPGARLSEHAKGRAIDISAFQMRDGTVLTVRNGWKDARTREVTRKIHRGACGPFGTVLGPAADRFHHSHFHLDTARYRSGPYCR